MPRKKSDKPKKVKTPPPPPTPIQPSFTIDFSDFCD